MSETDYGPARPDELDRLSDILRWSFAIPREDLTDIFTRIGPDRMRVMREGGRVVAGLALIPMGQFFGGRAVPMTGVSLVGAAPEARGRGGATRLMQACVREMRASGVPISALYPAKQTLYRRAGWEVAGARWELSVNARDLATRSRQLVVRPIEPGDASSVRSLYRRVASAGNGTIDRTDAMWERVTNPLKFEVQGFLAEGEDGPEAYAYLRVTRNESLRQEILATDLHAATAAGAQRLLAFLADHDSLADRIVWCGDPAGPVPGMIDEFVWKGRIFFPWMLRVLDPKSALEARGWPPGLSAELSFDLEDPDLPENAGRFVLEVSDGQGRVRSGGDGRIRAHVRALAALYGGWTTPSVARAMGLLDGPEEDLARAGAAFATSIPWMSDMF